MQFYGGCLLKYRILGCPTSRILDGDQNYYNFIKSACDIQAVAPPRKVLT